jgi:hypothetical protein
VHNATVQRRLVLKIIATVLLTIIGILYTAAMHGFGRALSGGGMGARLFVYLIDGPESLCLLIWPMLFAFLPWTRIPKIALTVLSFSITPLVWASIVLSLEGFQDDMVRGIWKSARPVIYIFSVAFLLPSLLGLLISAKSVVGMIRTKLQEDAGKSPKAKTPVALGKGRF